VKPAGSRENTNLSSLGDALWWAVATATTVGYGDLTPLTVEDRVILTYGLACQAAISLVDNSIGRDNGGQSRSVKERHRVRGHWGLGQD
jgi:voltage-gated potassium channel Kch